MMAAVPEADVIITNPTHYAVALQYDPEKGGVAPLLVAKGTDFIALKIREIGVEHKVQILESPALARAIYYSTEVEGEIPAGLYLAVAQVLAYVFQIRQYRSGRASGQSRLKKTCRSRLIFAATTDSSLCRPLRGVTREKAGIGNIHP